MSPFRHPQPPLPDPEVDTSELEALTLRKRKRMRKVLIGVFVATFLIPAAIATWAKVGNAREVRRWQAAEAEYEEQVRRDDAREEAREAELAKHTFLLTDDEKGRVVGALEAGRERLRQHLDALAQAWPDMVSHAITPGTAKCPVDVPAPEVGELSDVTNVDKSQDAPIAWVYVDGREEKFAQQLAKTAATSIGRSPDVDPVKGLLRISPAPRPAWITSLMSEEDGLYSGIDHPLLDTEHPGFVERSELLQKRAEGQNQSRRYQYFAIVDVWFVPAKDGDEKLIPGFVATHSFVWDTGEDRVVCAGRAVAESSRVVVGTKLDIGSLQRDLRLRLEGELASSMRAAVVPIKR